MLRSILYLATAAGWMAASAAIAQGAGYDRAARACAGMGLNPSEAPFVYCEMSLRESAVSGPRANSAALARRESTALPPAAVAGTDKPFRSYQRGDEMTSVYRACAQIGLVPGSQQYATCVGNLDMTIDDADRVGTD